MDLKILTLMKPKKLGFLIFNKIFFNFFEPNYKLLRLHSEGKIRKLI